MNDFEAQEIDRDRMIDRARQIVDDDPGLDSVTVLAILFDEFDGGTVDAWRDPLLGREVANLCT